MITRSGTLPIDAYGRQPDLILDELFDIADELDHWLTEALEHRSQIT